MVKHVIPDEQGKTPCRVCGGSGFIAQKQFIDDGYGEVDSCPLCDHPDGRSPAQELARCMCRHPAEWHGRLGCYAISAGGGCDCKGYVVDMIDALRIGLSPAAGRVTDAGNQGTSPAPETKER